MPLQGTGKRHVAIATKTVVHGAPVCEDGYPGIAAKSTQLGRYVDPASAAATLIAIGEDFVIMLGGVQEVLAANVPGGVGAAPPGTPVWINEDTNALVLPVAEVQTLTVTATGGTYTLAFDDEVTTALAFNAN